MEPLMRAAFLAALGLLVLTGGPGMAAAEVLPLETAIQVGLQNSQTVEGARYELDEADQLVREAWSNVLPQVTMDASYQRNTVTQQSFLPASLIDPGSASDQLVPVRCGSKRSVLPWMKKNNLFFRYMTPIWNPRKMS